MLKKKSFSRASTSNTYSLINYQLLQSFGLFNDENISACHVTSSLWVCWSGPYLRPAGCLATWTLRPHQREALSRLCNSINVLYGATNVILGERGGHIPWPPETRVTAARERGVSICAGVMLRLVWCEESSSDVRSLHVTLLWLWFWLWLPLVARARSAGGRPGFWTLGRAGARGGRDHSIPTRIQRLESCLTLSCVVPMYL